MFYDMKLIPAYPKNQPALPTLANLIIGSILVIPWPLTAQEQKPASAEEPAATPAARKNVPDPTIARALHALDRERASASPMRGGAANGDNLNESRFENRAELGAPFPGTRVPPPTNIAPARLEVTIYEVQVPEDRTADLYTLSLEPRAATAQSLAQALAEFGKTKVLYRIDQSVNLYSESISLVTSEPMVTGTRISSTGTALNTVTYQNVGLVVNISASAPQKDSPRKGLATQVSFTLAAIVDNDVIIAPNVKASSIRKVQINHSELPRFGKPVVQLNVSAPAGDDSTFSTAYVVRYVFNSLQTN